MSLHLINSKSIFFHIPKTGGTWIHRALENAGVETSHFTPKGFPHSTRHDENTDGYYTFAFVREPISWYKSYWKYRMNTGWEPSWWLDKHCKANNFSVFMRNVIRKQRPHVTELYARHLGIPSKLNFVGKQENIVEDLVHVLNEVGEKFDEEKLRDTPKQNVGDSESIVIDKTLENEILELEKVALTTWRIYE